MLNKIKNQISVFFWLTPFLVVTACFNNGSLDSQFLSGASLVVPAEIPMGGQFTISIAGIDPQAVIDANTSVVFNDEQGQVLNVNFSNFGTYITGQLPSTYSGKLTVALTMTLGTAVSTVYGTTYVIDPGGETQNILIQAAISNVSGAPFAVVSNDPTKIVGIPAIIGGQIYKFDLTQTAFANPSLSPSPRFQYEYDFGQGFYNPTEATFEYTFPASATLVPCYIQVTDTVTGIVQSMAFMAVVNCGSSSFIDVSQASITVSHSIAQSNNLPVIGFYDYQVNNVQGGNGDYSVRFDLNGDGIPDGLWTADGFVNSVVGLKVPDQFTIYNKVRPVSAYITDSCNNFAVLTQNVNFDIPFSNGTANTLQAPQIPQATSFLQVGLSGAAENNTEPSANAFISEVQDQNPPIDGIKRFTCNFTDNGNNSGSLFFQALTAYETNGTPNYHPQGLTFAVSNFAFGNFISTSGSLSFSTDAGTDGNPYTVARSYNQSNVPVTMSVASTTSPYLCTQSNTMGTQTIYNLDWLIGAATLTDSSGIKTDIQPNTGAGACTVTLTQCPVVNTPPNNPPPNNPPR